jgi:hypothetical protein
MTLASSIIAKAGIINYDSRIVIYSVIVLATVIMIVNYNHTVITIVNYNQKTFIVQATDVIKLFTSVICEFS